MKLTIEKYRDEEKYYILLHDDTPFPTLDYGIAEELNIPSHIFDSIIQFHNAVQFMYGAHNPGFEFMTREDIEGTIEDLIPYLIMINLTGE